MADKRDYYEVLGLSKDASDDEIKKAYRKLAKEYHPDLHPDDKACEAKFKEVSEAAQVLSDPEKRAKYDQLGHAAFDPNAGFSGFDGGFNGFGDIFGDIFGSFGDIFGGGGTTQRTGPRKGENVRVGVTVSFEEAALGCKKEVSISRVEPCPDCHGTGCEAGTTPEVCPDCHGTGSVRTTQRTPFGVVQSTGPCPKCGGSGKIIHQPCHTCRGKGNVYKTVKMTVTIPAGIDDGQTISLRGQGSAGRNGGPQGDLLVTVAVLPHSQFTRDGNAVFFTATITFTQATLGAEIEVPTLDGRVKLTIPEGTQPGTVLRLKGKGIPFLRGTGRGDQYVTVNVAVPKGLNSAQREALRAFASAMNEPDTEPVGIFGKKKRNG